VQAEMRCVRSDRNRRTDKLVMIEQQAFDLMVFLVRRSPSRPA
jgi:hypothetical protein